MAGAGEIGVAWRRLAASALACLSLAAGCVSEPPGEFGSAARRLQRVKGTDGAASDRVTAAGERELMSAFWSAAGVEVEDGELDAVLPLWAGGTGGGEAAMRRLATKHKRVLGELRADRVGLRQALDEGVCLLVMVPSEKKGSQLGIPLSWEDGWIKVRVGAGGRKKYPELDYFNQQERADYRALLLFDPSGPPPRQRTLALSLGDYLLKTGDFRRAETLFRAELSGDTSGDARASLGLGDALCRREKYPEAIPIYESALSLEPDNPRLANNFAYALLKCGERLDEAERLSSLACSKHPRNPLYLETAAEILLARSQPEAAASLLERAWSLSRDLPPPARLEIMDQLTRAWLSAGRESLAWQVFSACLREYPDAPVTKNLRKMFPRTWNTNQTPGALSR